MSSIDRQLAEENKLLKLLGISPEPRLQPRTYGDITKHPSYAGMVFSSRMNQEIPVLHKRGESKSQAIERVRKAHR